MEPTNRRAGGLLLETLVLINITAAAPEPKLRRRLCCEGRINKIKKKPAGVESMGQVTRETETERERGGGSKEEREQINERSYFILYIVARVFEAAEAGEEGRCGQQKDVGGEVQRCLEEGQTYRRRRQRRRHRRVLRQHRHRCRHAAHAHGRRPRPKPKAESEISWVFGFETRI